MHDFDSCYDDHAYGCDDFSAVAESEVVEEVTNNYHNYSDSLAFIWLDSSNGFITNTEQRGAADMNQNFRIGVYASLLALAFILAIVL